MIEARNTPTEIDSQGNKIWKNTQGQIHRNNDLPAVIYSNGGEEWYQNGQGHRDNDKPAVVEWDGTQYWYQNGQFHRDNGLPAVINADG